MSVNIAIIDYGSGNLHSAKKALELVAPNKARVTAVTSASALKDATHIVLPGVGAFADCKRGVEAISGMVDALKEAAFAQKKPFLGICVGMQLLAKMGYEHGEHMGFGWFDASVKILPSKGLKIPHMGWNALILKQNTPLFKGINEGDHAYFVHSYAMECKNKGDIFAEVEYGKPVVAVVAKDNIFGTQFHPEKSQKTGLRLLKNFMDL